MGKYEAFGGIVLTAHGCVLFGIFPRLHCSCRYMASSSLFILARLAGESMLEPKIKRASEKVTVMSQRNMGMRCLMCSGSR